jgi:hypothetical protein
MFKNRKLIIILSSITASLLLIVAILFSSLLIKEGVEKRNNQAAADKVIAHIEQLSGIYVTLESENIIMTVKTEYDLLTDKQKLLVTNYPTLQKSIQELQLFKDKKIADEINSEIKRINKSTLTADNTSVAALLDKYDALTDSQKALVTNYDLLLELKKTVDKKIAEQETKDMGLELAEKFAGYDGKWGNFGAHKNAYQGLIEEALHRDVNYKKYFSTAANSLQFNITRFEKDRTVFGIGIAYYDFRGKDKKNGYNGTLYGEIIIREDGTVYATESGYYNDYY